MDKELELANKIALILFYQGESLKDPMKFKEDLVYLLRTENLPANNLAEEYMAKVQQAKTLYEYGIPIEEIKEKVFGPRRDINGMINPHFVRLKDVEGRYKKKHKTSGQGTTTKGGGK